LGGDIAAGEAAEPPVNSCNLGAMHPALSRHQMHRSCRFPGARDIGSRPSVAHRCSHRRSLRAAYVAAPTSGRRWRGLPWTFPLLCGLRATLPPPSVKRVPSPRCLQCRHARPGGRSVPPSLPTPVTCCLQQHAARTAHGDTRERSDTTARPWTVVCPCQAASIVLKSYSAREQSQCQCFVNGGFELMSKPVP
jgi:hypothetical protein